MVRGPGIAEGTTIPEVLGNVDFAPTLLDLAGVTPPREMDGRSFAPLLLGTATTTAKPWRTTFLSQFQSLGLQYFGKNDIWNQSETLPFGETIKAPLAREDDPTQWFIYDNAFNSWVMLRTLNSTHNMAYIEATNSSDPRNPTPVLSYELYDVGRDPYQLTNIYHEQPPSVQADWHTQLHAYYLCQGDGCP